VSKTLLKSTVVTGGMTFVSRVTGLVRDVLLARLIGASAGVSADAFYVAFRIPNFFRRIFGEGAFSQAFVPVFVEYDARETAQSRSEFLDSMTGVLSLVLFAVTAAGVIAAPLLVMVLAPGFIGDGGKFDLTVQMLRITFPYLMFISLVAMAAGMLNARGRFGAAAFTPVLLNLSLIGAALWLAPRVDEPVIALAWGVFIAGFVQLAFQLPFLARLRILPRPRLRAGHAGVKRVFRLMLPAVFGSSVAQINLLVNTVLASFLVTGSVSWLYYSDRLMEFPLGVFGIALATVILPSLSRSHAEASAEQFSNLMDWALRWVFLIGVPATVALAVLAEPMLATLFHYGAFTGHDVHMSALSLVAFAIGLPGFILVKVLAPGFYARQDTATPAKVAVAAMAVNIAVSLALVYPLAHTGLALAVSIAAFVNAGLLYGLLRRQGVYAPRGGWALFLARVGAASAALGAALWWGAGDGGQWLAMALWERIARLAALVAGGMVIYVIAIAAVGIRPRELLLRKVVERLATDG
jgi:putative peptidoglycan lipid II flippase